MKAIKITEEKRIHVYVPDDSVNWVALIPGVQEPLRVEFTISKQVGHTASVSCINKNRFYLFKVEFAFVIQRI